MAEPYIGQITMVGFNFAPRGWAQCDGAILPISQHQTLFAIIGNKYGGDGISTFALPDMKGRVPVHQGALANQWHYSMGDKGGVEEVTLSQTELPEHTHNLMASQDNADAYSPVKVPLLATQVENAQGELRPLYNNKTPSVAMAGDSISNTGGNLAHNNMQPVQVINFIIATEGLFPPRN